MALGSPPANRPHGIHSRLNKKIIERTISLRVWVGSAQLKSEGDVGSMLSKRWRMDFPVSSPRSHGIPKIHLRRVEHVGPRESLGVPVDKIIVRAPHVSVEGQIHRIHLGEQECAVYLSVLPPFSANRIVRPSRACVAFGQVNFPPVSRIPQRICVGVAQPRLRGTVEVSLRRTPFRRTVSQRVIGDYSYTSYVGRECPGTVDNS